MRGMVTAAHAVPVSAYVRNRAAALLDERRVVIWYDPERVFGGLLDGLKGGCVIVSAADSGLRARRAADGAYRKLGEGDTPAESRKNVLVYVPAARGATPEEQQADPFEGLARCGTAFGAIEAERLEGLARLALPDHEAEIARLFREGRPSLALLDQLLAGARYPLVRQALGAESAVEAVTAALTQADTAERLAQMPGSLAELGRLAETAFGLPAGAKAKAEDWAALRTRLGTYLLFSEFAFDIAGALPDTLAAVPHALEAQRRQVLDVCERLRESDAGREAYAELARSVEKDLRLPGALGSDPPIGTRDTFPWQERRRLAQLIQAAGGGDVAAARAMLVGGSIWRRDPERAVLWQVAQRCIEFLEAAALYRVSGSCSAG